MVIYDAAHADVEYQACVIRLEIEHHRLEYWGEVTGLNDKTHAARYERQMKHNAPLVVATLSQIKLLLRDLRRSKQEFEDISDDSRNASTANPSSASRVSDIAEPNATAVVTDVSAAWEDAKGMQHVTLQKKQNFLRRSWAAAKKPAGQPKRFRWVLHDRSKVEKGLAQVSNLIDYLHELLNQDQLATLVESTENFKLTLLQLSTNVSEMKALLQGGRIERKDLTAASPPFSLAGSTLVAAEDAASVCDDGMSDKTASRTTAFWTSATQFSIAMISKYNEAQPSYELTQSERSQLSLGDDIDPDLRTAVSTVGDGVGWVEWRRFDTEVSWSESGEVESRIPDIVADRIEKLVALLQEPNKPEEFCVPSLPRLLPGHQ